MNRQKILIVDDSEMNREMLKAILGEGYKYAEAVDGAQALRMLQQDMHIDLVLLDINMPKMDGFAVLEHMNQFRWIDEVPVIMISAADDRESIKRCYSLGVADYIRRPFDSYIVQRRVKNTLRLYSNQKRLMGMVSDQIYRNQRDSNVMIGILSHIVEFRNSESAQHVLQVQTVTGMLLRRLVEKTDVYHLTEEKIRLIVTASALHDIGKISIPENILNKPGRLTPEEFDVIRTHPAIGASMLEGLTPYRKEPLLKTAIEICRWHHERWDGRGYPDGLLGEQIPISAQVVALADVYDVLTSDRCYKKAYSHDTAVSMILNGECGAFNPMLLDCLQEISANLRHALPLLAVEQSMKKDAQRLSSELLRNSNMPRSDRAQRELDSLREKMIFFASCCGGVQFEYDTISQSVLVVDWSRPGKQSRTIMDVNDPDNMRPLRPADVARLHSALKATTPENNELSISVLLPVAGEQHWHSIRLHTLWSPLSPGSYIGVIGCMTDTQKEQSSHAPLCCADKSTANRPLIVEDMQRLGRIFDVVRLVDPSANAVLELDADGSRFLLDRTRGEDMQLFLDPLTGVYARRYFETYRTHLEGMEGVALIDVNSFKHINDTCGHAAGDAALRDIAGAIRSCIRKTDILIRYGGDEFLLLFPRMTEEIFLEKKKQIQQAVRGVRMSEFADIQLSVSVGGVCGVHPITEAIRKADYLMYLDKAEQQP